MARLAPALYLTSLSQNLKDHGHFLSTALISRVFASYKHISLFTSEAKKEQLAGLWSLTCLVSLNSKEPFFPGIEFTCLLTPVLVQPGEGVARLHLSVRTLSQAVELSNKVLYHSEKEFSLLG